jgi:TonB-linked SusC/RagA family outer membrane protein
MKSEHNFAFKFKKRVLLVIFLSAILPGVLLFSQSRLVDISGVVINTDGEAMIGVTVVAKLSQSGTITDINGKFTMKVPENETIIVSYLGYITQEFSASTLVQSKQIILKEEIKALSEVVVVGYGTQRRVNLTGAVTSIDLSQTTESRPITNISTALAGMSAGLYVNQVSGRPNASGAALLVRGRGTLNNSSPLVIIDGIEGSIADVNPQDVEAVSVLKDASSSAIYGSRAANGVILITTKKGVQGKSSVSYHGNTSIARPSNTIALVSDYADYMGYYNEAMSRSSVNQPFSQAKIDEWRANPNDPYRYPNTNPWDEVFTTGIAQNHNLSFNKGAKGFNLFGSIGYLNNPGIVENSAYERFSARMNVSADIKPWFSVGMNISGLKANADIGSNYVGNLFDGIGSPGIVYRAPDGRYGGPENSEESQQLQSPLYRLNSRKGSLNDDVLNTRFSAILNPFKGFTVEGSFNYRFSTRYEEEMPVYADRWSFQTNTITQLATGDTFVRNRNNRNTRYLGDVVAKYEANLTEKLQINVMAGASQEKVNVKWFEARKLDLIDNKLSVINAATGAADASGAASDWVMHSYFSRINIGWDDKYLFEANIRRDGSSRFAEGYRWGIFPSFSVGWRINEESFLKDAMWVDMLKLRASWGGLGNNAVGNYEWQSVYNDDNYVLNNTVQQGLTRLSLANAALQWETTNVTNVGLDFSFLASEIVGTIDLFDKDTRNILIGLPAPLLVGNAKIPTQNAARVNNKGVEASIKWQKKIQRFNYHIGGNFTYVRNVVTKYKGEDKTINGNFLIQEGQPINVLYVLAADRILQTDEDMELVQQMIDNAPIDPATGQKMNPFAAYGRPQRGDILYKDMNQDGIINENDRYTVGNGNTPTIMYGLSLGAGWKGIDVSVIFQGIGGFKTYWQDSYYTTGLVYGAKMNREIAENSWREGVTDAKFPRMLYYTNTLNNRPSDFWIQNKSFLRLKNLQIGYKLPSSLTKKLNLEQIRLYSSMENLLTFTRYKGIDPEINGTNYPTLQQISFGLNINF